MCCINRLVDHNCGWRAGFLVDFVPASGRLITEASNQAEMDATVEFRKTLEKLKKSAHAAVEMRQKVRLAKRDANDAFSRQRQICQQSSNVKFQT